jgi:hypothetical protein
VVFSTFLWAKKQLNFFFKHCRVRTKKLHKIKLDFFFLILGKIIMNFK